MVQASGKEKKKAIKPEKVAPAAEKAASSTATAETATAVSEGGRGLEKSREGLVVSNKMNKTVVVAVTRQVQHAMYGKYLKKTSKHYAHDEKNECQIGDLVRIVETRPLSKLKRWRVQKVLNRASV